MSSNFKKVHPLISGALADWLRLNPNGRQQLEAAGVPPTRIERLANGDLSEAVLSMVEKPLFEICKIDLKELTFLAARAQLHDGEWSGEDRLPRITNYATMLEAFNIVCEEVGYNKIRYTVNMFDNRFQKLIKGEARGSVNRIMLMLEIVYRHQNGLPLPKATRPEQKPVDQKVDQKSVLENNSVRELPRTSHPFPDGKERMVIGSLLTSIAVQVNLLEVLTEGNPEVILGGDQMKTLKLCMRLLNALGISKEVLEKLRTQNPITDRDPLFGVLKDLTTT